jgi:hypothetical protein
MKNKNLTYVMVVVVGIVWYNVFFRIKSNLEGEDGTLPVQNAQPLAVKALARDTFALHANYADPFRGGSNTAVAMSADLMAPPPVPVYVEPKAPKVEYWPKVQYYGLVKRTESKRPLCIINIDDMLFYLREGESVSDNYVIRRIFRDSVIIQHNKTRRTFRK